MRILIAILLCASTVNAGERPWHRAKLAHFFDKKPHPMSYLKTHKELLIIDTLTVAALGAAYGSSVNCQRVGQSPTNPKVNYCLETDGFLSEHPSVKATGGYVFGGISLTMITFNHLIWHYAPAPELRQTILFTNIGMQVDTAMEAWSNAQTSQRIEACYHNGLCK